MIPDTDEQMLRSALADLTNDQPPMPPARFQSVRRRAIWHRRHQLTGALVSALAVAGIIVGAGRVPGILHQPPMARHVPGWALPWPDYRTGSVPQSVLNNAVLAWRIQTTGVVTGHGGPMSPRQIARLVAPYHVTWYVGQTVAEGQDVAVIFEATSPDTGPMLIVGSATASDVMRGQPAWSGDGSSPWALKSVTAPSRPDSFGPDISEYVPEQSASGTGTDNWIVVLPAPGYALTIRGATNAGGADITGIHSHGVYVANAGQITADVLLGFGAGRGESVPVGIGGAPDTPTLAPPALTPPASFGKISGITGQGSTPWLDDESTGTRSGGPYAVIASCYNAPSGQAWWAHPAPGGHGPLRILINRHSIGTIACDGQQHELAVPNSLLGRHGVLIGASSSKLTSWQLAFGRPR